METITIYRGDTKAFTSTATRTLGDVTTAVNLTGATIWFTVKRSFSDDDGEALFQKSGTEGGATDGITFTSPTAGVFEVTVATGDTDDLAASLAEHLFFDLRLLEADGTLSTLQVGKVSVLPNVTRTTS